MLAPFSGSPAIAAAVSATCEGPPLTAGAAHDRRFELAALDCWTTIIVSADDVPLQNN